MDYVWSPWRYAYIAGSIAEPKPAECVFCEALKKPDDVSLVVYRGKKVFVILNRYPYTSGM